MRRLLSILLFGAILFPLIAPVLATGAIAESSLPACCRRAGKHQCGMLASERAMASSAETNAAPKSINFAPPVEQCPYRQRSLAASHLQVFAATLFAGHAAHFQRPPSAAAQAECLHRISFDRSRQKRGPPTLLS